MSLPPKLIAGIMGVGAVVWIFWPKEAKASENASAQNTEGGPYGDRPNPLDPLATPKLGDFYAVKAGDTMLGIIRRAGAPRARNYELYKAMLEDGRNQWIGRTRQKNDSVYSEVLRFHRRFAPVRGHESRPWAYQTEYRDPSPENKWPVVYVPGTVR